MLNVFDLTECAQSYVIRCFSAGLSQAKSEDRSRSYTIPNLPYQQTSETCLKDQIICQVRFRFSPSKISPGVGIL